LLRQDNADLRLTEKGYLLGLASPERFERLKNKKEQIEKLREALNYIKMDPEMFNSVSGLMNTAPLKEKSTLIQLLKRPEITLNSLSGIDSLKELTSSFEREIIEQVEIQIKYETYIDKEKKFADKMELMEDFRIPGNFDFKRVSSLSTEGREKLINIKPATIGQASRISGVSPSDISILMVYLGK
jgi:tRNA uridine 5-carboxymethylaminomethyl modification enzyme